MDLLSNSDKLELIEKKLENVHDEVSSLIEELRQELRYEEMWEDDD